MHKAPKHPRQTKSDIGRAYWAFHDGVASELRPLYLPWVSTSDLETIEALAGAAPSARMAHLHAELMRVLAELRDRNTEESRAAFRSLYDQALDLALPATRAYLAHSQAINDLTRSHSLAAVDLETLKAIDQLAHSDPTYRDFVDQLVAKLGKKVQLSNVIAYGQFFEIYGEAMTLRFLRSRPGVRVVRVPEDDQPRPDFECQLESGEVFYVEVKSLDIVDGEFRQREMLEAGLDVAIELEAQRRGGAVVASAVGEIAPYKGLEPARGYDPRSLLAVISTLRKKCRGAFKSSQFQQGPTFALAILDRLLLPGGLNDLAPYYFEPFNSGACVSGVLWHVAYGVLGSPIFRVCDFEGAPTLEGPLDAHGLFADPVEPFPGIGLIALDVRGNRRVGFGLAGTTPREGWSRDLTERALEVICDEYNDHENSRAFRVSHADQCIAAQLSD